MTATALCREEGIEDEQDQKVLLRLLHDLGAILHFEERWTPLRETMVLNPEWVTGGVYRILNDELLRTHQHGKLHRDILDDLLDPTKYPPERHPFLLRMMERFELCFPLDEEGWYLIPGLLPVEPPNAVQGFEDDYASSFT
jgi:hypothetical protein